MDDQNLLKKIISIRRQIHRHPELGNQEFKTASLVEKVLKELKIPFKRTAKTGVVAKLKNSDAPWIALRADMDALPLTEKRKTSYCSKIAGVMHACGHDAHVAMLLGAASILSKKNNLKNNVKFLFQPNEEGAGGAKELIKNGAMENVRSVFGLHVNPRLPSGTIGLKAGALMAAVGQFEIEILGKGGHAAYPQEGKDAMIVACELVGALQTIVSRKIDPVEPAVLTVGTIQGGTRFNILADRVVLTGTIRTLSQKLHRQIPRMIRQIASGVTKAHGARFEMEYQNLGPVLYNSKAAVEQAKRAAASFLGESKIILLENASMGGEDFAEYLKLAPGCFIYIGVGNRALRTEIPWHHPEFDLDEPAMLVGSKLLAAVCEGGD